MASTHSTFTIDRELAEHARRLGVNVSAAAREAVEAAVRAAMARADQEAHKRRPVLVLTRSEVIGVRALVTVAEVTTSIRGIAAEAAFDDEIAGLDRPSAINCDGLHTITKTSLATYAGSVSEATMARVCSAVGYALGC